MLGASRHLYRYGQVASHSHRGQGYRRVEIEGVRILRSGQRRGITRTLKAMIKRRSAIEPAIGHMKMDGRLGRNPLKEALGDALQALMAAPGTTCD